MCEWNVKNDSTVGSGHFLIWYTMIFDVTILDRAPFRREGFHIADWEKFGDHCLKFVRQLSLERLVDVCAASDFECCKCICTSE